MGIILCRTDVLPVTAVQLPCRHSAFVPVAAIQLNTLCCIAQHITMHINAGCSKAVAHARYQCSSCLTQTRTLTLLVALPATSRMLHTFFLRTFLSPIHAVHSSRPAGHAGLEKSTTCGRYLLKRVFFFWIAIHAVCVYCMFLSCLCVMLNVSPVSP